MFIVEVKSSPIFTCVRERICIGLDDLKLVSESLRYVKVRLESIAKLPVLEFDSHCFRHVRDTISLARRRVFDLEVLIEPLLGRFVASLANL